MEEEVKEPEIPAELEGVSPDIAAEIMKEAADLESAEETAETEENDAAQEETQEDEKSAPESGDESKEQAETKAKTEEENKQPGAIPFTRFSEVNERMKAAEAKVAAYEAAKQQQLPATTLAPPQSPQEEQLEQALGIDRKQLIQSAVKIAKHNAMQVVGIKEEEFDYADSDKKRAFESAYQMEFAQITNQMDSAITARKHEYAEAIQAQSAANEEYNKLVNKFQTDGDFGDVFHYAETEYIKKLSPLDQRALQVAFARTEAKQGSLQDVIIVRDHFTRAQQEYRDKQKPPAPAQAQQTDQTKKIKQMQAHPRTDQLTGDSGDGGNKDLTLSDIEKMLNDPNITIDQIPVNWRKKLLV